MAGVVPKRLPDAGAAAEAVADGAAKEKEGGGALEKEKMPVPELLAAAVKENAPPDELAAEQAASLKG